MLLIFSNPCKHYYWWEWKTESIFKIEIYFKKTSKTLSKKLQGLKVSANK